MDPISNRVALGAAGGGAAGIDLIKTATNSPYLEAYPFDPSTGFGTRYANPSTLPTNGCLDVCITSDNSAVIFAHEGSPYIAAYTYTVGSGIGTKYANPSTAVGASSQSYCISMHPDDNAVAVGTDGSPYINVYAWSSSGFGAKYSNPGTTISGSMWDLHFHPSGDAIITAAQGNYEYSVVAFPWSSSTGFGTKYTSPSYVNAMLLRCCQFSPDGNYALIGGEKAPYVYAINFSVSTGFGSFLANPGTNPGNYVNSLKFDSAGNYLAVCTSGSTVNGVYEWSSSGFGSYIAGGWYNDTSDAAFTPDSDAVAFMGAYESVSGYNSRIAAFQWSSSGFGTTFTPATSLNTNERFDGIRFTNAV